MKVSDKLTRLTSAVVLLEKRNNSLELQLKTLMYAAESVIYTVAMDHKEHSEVKKLIEHIGLLRIQFKLDD